MKIKKTIKFILCALLHGFGFNAFYARFIARQRLTLVRYHSVSDAKNTEALHAKLYPHLAVDTLAFRRQLTWMRKRGYTFLHFSDIARLRKEQKSLPNRSALIYFDDGYKDNLVNAMPILRELDIPATIFITTGFIDGTHELWSMRIRYIISQATQSMFVFNGKRFEGRGEVVARKIIAEGKLRTPPERLEAETKTLAESTGVVTPIPRDMFLTWADMKTMDTMFEFGSHGMTHQRLDRMNETVVHDELYTSRQRIADMLGKPVQTCSYPHGAYIAATERIAGELFEYAVTTDDGLNSLIRPNWLHLQSVKAATNGHTSTFTSELGCWNIFRNFKNRQ